MKKLSLLAALIASLSNLAQAQCWNEAGARYQIDPVLLRAIAIVESGLNPQAFHYNKNGTYDIGIMQINNSHLPRLSKFGITKKNLLSDPCVSIMTGAWILSEFIERSGYTWNAVGAYNAGLGKDRQDLRNAYIEKVAKQYHSLRDDAQN
ncbi:MULTISPECIES: lytic transglycosylase domain-containing protein [unclassified Undibacterium]|uniref:lytic transglycosylase domain-containing protein n=1 Tax=unclassified Undibacterium TaxID=2630295 RepID=UPI002AC9BA60|nr:MULTISPECIES: lytic transglycosylase domain-containing protein [unclassified Undibacterium]MEB0141186.1 lytic transglycosylase domain-containing protein [Undibacterium sp. CCC2.1]MEB0174231.1 lytic transglycosylase domain-containing protein [Undibacterium sp. CCC1.1]MEB0178174.1 lytic transglycosylase domain-containing protein [Undibacterium sp. CCC3.4]MEB0217376.1 lytic transglycosylase domain-containing protein [Undibacterium sp. 5I2]WPX43461.1 lytic transglycosylase domain-containing pro